MNIDYSQFLNMIPEVSLTVLLVIAFIADFCSAKNVLRKWFNPLVCVLMLVHILINLAPTDLATAFGGMYITNSSIGVIKSILALGTDRKSTRLNSSHANISYAVFCLKKKKKTKYERSKT